MKEPENDDKTNILEVIKIASARYLAAYQVVVSEINNFAYWLLGINAAFIVVLFERTKEENLNWAVLVALGGLISWLWSLSLIIRLCRWNIEYYNLNLQELKNGMLKAQAKINRVYLDQVEALTDKQNRRLKKLGKEIGHEFNPIMNLWGIGGGLFLVYHILDMLD